MGAAVRARALAWRRTLLAVPTQLTAPRRGSFTLRATVRGPSASADGGDDVSPASSEARASSDAPAVAPSASGAPQAAGAEVGVRARLRAVRDAPVVAAVLAGGKRGAAWVASFPLLQQRARLAKLAKAADAAVDDAAKEDAYLMSLAQRRCAFPQQCGCAHRVASLAPAC